ncbi:CCD62 protein, partial [Bucco capensis]|nr:CCD62 protein [Bucco capensis]
IIQQLRQENQLLTAELKGRDKLLSDTVAKHETQLQAWRCDRQKVLTCTKQCSLLKDELNERDQMIKSLTQRLKEMSEKVRDATAHCQALEEKNQSLHCLVLELSAKKGQLQVRQQELLTMLELKDEAELETISWITEFTSKFKKLESALHAAETEKLHLSKDKQDLERSVKKLILARGKLKDDLHEKMKENNKQQEKIIRLTEENGYLRRELALRVGKANTKDQFLQVAKSKQARTDTERSSLQQV